VQSSPLTALIACVALALVPTAAKERFDTVAETAWSSVAGRTRATGRAVAVPVAVAVATEDE
jgi:broad specificity phosphatase PhoE